MYTRCYPALCEIIVKPIHRGIATHPSVTFHIHAATPPSVTYDYVCPGGEKSLIRPASGTFFDTTYRSGPIPLHGPFDGFTKDMSKNNASNLEFKAGRKDG